ncbi:hypothetical protein D3C76_567130 [compost metagenome]
MDVAARDQELKFYNHINGLGIKLDAFSVSAYRSSKGNERIADRYGLQSSRPRCCSIGTR